MGLEDYGFIKYEFRPQAGPAHARTMAYSRCPGVLCC